MEKNSELAFGTKEILNSIGFIVNSVLGGVKESLQVGLNWTADRFDNLSDEKILQFEDLPVLFQKASESLQNTAYLTTNGMNVAIEETTKAFNLAKESIDIADDYTTKALYENKVISSILGSSHDSLLSFSKIKLSLRINNEDVSVETCLENFRNSNLQKAILYIPGLFCDEKLWIKTSEDDGGLGDYYLNKGYYPFYIRYNQGAHISENGKLLEELIRKIYEQSPNIDLSIISYSQGGLVLRSALYYAKDKNETYVKKIKKIVLISSPNGGSYIEKIGFWAGIIMQASPFWYLKIAGIIGNLRSDAIKDLSHGVIREYDWKTGNQVSRYNNPYYFGELDDLDVYQVYSFAFQKENLFGLFFGDGIIEKPSLEALDQIYFSKFDAKENRTHVIYEANHYKIMNLPELYDYLDSIFSKE